MKTISPKDTTIENKHKNETNYIYESSYTQNKKSKSENGNNTHWITNMVSSGLAGNTV